MKANRLLALASTVAAAAGAQAQSAQQPNIIFFLVDDMGWQETSVPFYDEPTALNHRYRTPNMERMARLGVKFTQAYASAISLPSRCSLMTGMNAARHRVTNWTLQYNTKTDASGGSLTLPDWNYNGLQPDTVTSAHDRKNAALATALPEVLHRAGYYTIHCGKAHWGTIGTAGENPLSFGFDVNIAGGAHGAPGSYLAQDNYGSGAYHVPGLEKYYAQGTFLTEALTIEALAAIEKPVAEGKPFYLYMSHYAIHTPYNPDSRFTGNYMENGVGVYDEQLQDRLNTQEVNHAALIEGMDHSLGQMLDWLEAHPDVARNTVLLFMSDNGGQAVSVRQGRANYDQNYPARAGKGSAYQGGNHEPMMVYWPGVTEGGTTNDNRIIIEDFFPTIAEMAGADISQCSQTIDGKSFVDILRNPGLRRERSLIWHYPNRWGESQDRREGYGAYSAILNGDYHLIYFWANQERRLYNIRTDIGEQNNLADEMPELTMKLAAELTDSLIHYGAQRPSIKATGEVVPWPVDGVRILATGDAVSPKAQGVFEYSDDETTHLYRIQDKRPSSGSGPFYWTMGMHNGYKALQCTNQRLTADGKRETQLFYMKPGSDSEHFQLYTFDGQRIDYLPGRTGDSWNNGNIGSGTTMNFLQYGTATSGDFQIHKSDSEGYYGFSATGIYMNDRGTSHGTAANMKWVVATYSGNGLTDTGSLYRFISEGSVPTAITSVPTDNPRPGTRHELAAMKDVTVYSTDGRRMTRIDSMPDGIYIVRHDREAYAVKVSGH